MEKVLFILGIDFIILFCDLLVYFLFNKLSKKLIYQTGKHYLEDFLFNGIIVAILFSVFFWFVL